VADAKRPDLKIMGDTKTAGGTFGNVKLTGGATFSGDVDCLRLSHTGELEVEGSLKTERLRVTGNCRTRDRLEAGSVGGRGEVRAGTGIRSGKIGFTGHIDAGGDVEAETLQLDGALSVGGLLGADSLDVKMYGPCRAKEVGGTSIRVRRSRATKLMNLVRAKADATFSADEIEGDTVELEHTEAKVVRGNRVKLGPGCRIGRVEYRDSLDKHADAVVNESVKR